MFPTLQPQLKAQHQAQLQAQERQARRAHCDGPHGKVDIGDGLAHAARRIDCHSAEVQCALPGRWHLRPSRRSRHSSRQSVGEQHHNPLQRRQDLNRIEKTLKAFDDGVKSAVIVEMINIHIREHGSCKRKQVVPSLSSASTTNVPSLTTLRCQHRPRLLNNEARLRPAAASIGISIDDDVVYRAYRPHRTHSFGDDPSRELRAMHRWDASLTGLIKFVDIGRNCRRICHDVSVMHMAPIVTM